MVINMFKGFSQQTGDFMLGLMFNNERPWFESHRTEYEEYLLKPFKALASDTAELMLSRHPDMGLDLHVARIYRDARRLHGRGPYKEHLWFSLKNWDGLLRGPMFWFEVGAVDYSFGMGFYTASTAQMDSYRKSIEANPARFLRIIRGIAAHPEFESDVELYARQKKDMGEELNPWYNCRRVGAACTREFDGELFSEKLPVILADAFDALMPLYEYLMTYCPPEPYRKIATK